MNTVNKRLRQLKIHHEYYVPALFLIIFFAFVVATALVKPDRMVQVVPMMVLWPFALLVIARLAPSLFRSRRYVLFTVVITYLPLMNTWPARIVRYSILHIDTHGWMAFLQPVFVGLCALLVLFPPKLRRQNILFVGALSLWAVGGIISLVRTPDLSLSIEHLVAGAFTPILAYMVFVSVPLAENEWMAALSGFFVSALCPVVLGFLGYFEAYGVPLTAAAFMHNKMQMYLVSTLQTYTYGNVDHLAEYLLLTVVPALGLLSYWKQEPARLGYWTKFALALFVVPTVILVVLIQVRGFVIVLLTALLLAGIYNVTRKRLLRSLPTAAMFVVVAVSSLLLYGSFYRGLVPTFTTSHVARVASDPPIAGKTKSVPHETAKSSQEIIAADKGTIPTVRSPTAGKTKSVPHETAKSSQEIIAADPAANSAVAAPTRSAAAWFSVKDTSANLRWDAIKNGVRILKSEWPLGVGIGTYAIFDPRFTAAHSFAVQVMAETGVFGAFFVLVLVAYMVVRFVLSWFRQSAEFWFALTCVAFVAYLYAFGGVMAIIGISVWGVVFALWVALMEMPLFPETTT